MRKHIITKELIEDWQFYKNYLTIESALKDLAEHKIRLSEEKLILDAIRDVKNLIKRLGKSITDFQKGNQDA